MCRHRPLVAGSAAEVFAYRHAPETRQLQPPLVFPGATPAGDAPIGGLRAELVLPGVQ